MATPLDDPYWQEERQIAWDELHTLIMDTMLQGMENALPLLPAAIRPLIDYELANEYALNFLHDYKFSVVDGIIDTSEKQTVNAFSNWMKGGDSLSSLINELAPTYGRTRAKRIATTEVTRVYAAGNMAMWQSTGVVGGKKWQTARDERVCPICGPLHGRTVAINNDFTLSPREVAESSQMRAIMGDAYNPAVAMHKAGQVLRSFGGSQPHAPAHVSCRCWILPFVGIPLLEDRIGRILAYDFFAKVKQGQILTVDAGVIMPWE